MPADRRDEGSGTAVEVKEKMDVALVVKELEDVNPLLSRVPCDTTWPISS